jgi:hypothetical protein
VPSRFAERLFGQRAGAWIARILLSSLGLSAHPAPTFAQTLSSQCTDPSIVGSGLQGQDGCQKALDVYHYVNVQLGTLLAGGNAMLRQGGTLGGLGHVALSLRGNAMQTSVPRGSDIPFSVGPAGPPENIPVQSRVLAVPVIDAGIGVFGGLGVGLTRMFGVDVLLTGSLFPSITTGQMRIAASGSTVQVGYGLRLGILQEGEATPGVGVTWLHGSLPTLEMRANHGTDSLIVQDYDLSSDAWRITASKRFSAVGLAAGIGQDHYHSDARLSYDLAGVQPLGGAYAISTGITRFTYFGDLSVSVGPISLIGEIGQVHGGAVTTYNIFSPDPSSSRTYWSLGIRGDI